MRKGKEPAHQESSTLESDSQRLGLSQIYIPQVNKVDLHQLLRRVDDNLKPQFTTKKSLISALKLTLKQDILVMMMRIMRAFEVDIIIWKKDETHCFMQKDYCTADQWSDINVIYSLLIKHLELKLHSA